MRGRFYIDGRDAFTEWGVFIEQYGYKELIQMPSYKKLASTEWPDEDGAETDLTAPVLDTRTLALQFCITNIRYAEDLFDELSIGAYHEFNFPELQKTYRLRMTQNGSLSQNIRLGKLTITFAEDAPQPGTDTPYRLNESDTQQKGYELDGVDFSQFGTYVLKGSDEQLRKAAQVRQNLSVSSAASAGVEYDGEQVTFKTKDVTLNLLISAPSITDFWKRWNALFSVLIGVESRLFYFATMGAEYDCYYKSNKVSKFDILRDGRVWCEFQITLVFTSYHPQGQYMLLATEDFNFVCTEDGQKLIRVRPKRGISLLVSQDGKYIITEQADKIYLNN